jgi:ribonuclease P protein component
MQKIVMLKKTDEFSSVFSFRKRISSSVFLVHYMPNGTQQTRIGFIVAKKIAKLAVDRNYMRRVLRELCRHNSVVNLTSDALASVNIETDANIGVDAIIQVQKKFSNADFAKIEQELKVIFDKIQSRLKAQKV